MEAGEPGALIPPPAPRRALEPAGPTFAIAFGGGGARGLAHIHVIEAMDELGIRPKAISGSSIGAIMGAAMASGMSGSDIHEYARSVLRRRAEVASRIWRARPESFSEMVADGFRLGQFNAERILHSFLPPQIPDRFDQLVIPLSVTATDYYAHGQHVLDSGDLYFALAASAAIPAVFRPIVDGERVLIDGGISNPVPFDLVAGKADITIAIDVVGAPTTSRRKKLSAVDLMFGASQIMMQSIIALKLQERRPEVLIRPPVSHFRVLDFLKIEQVMGETAAVKDEFKRAVADAVERCVKPA